MEKLAAVVALIAAFGLTTAPAVDAGVDSGGRADITYRFVGGDDALAAAAAAGAELFDEAGMTVTTQCSDTAPVGNAFNADFTTQCVNLTTQTYTVGVTDIDGYDVDYAECCTLLRGKPIDLPDATFDFVEGDLQECDAYLYPAPILSEE
jgi:hypothetical protein